MKIYLNIKLIGHFSEEYYINVIGISNYELPLTERKKNNFINSFHIDNEYFKEIRSKLINVRYIYIRGLKDDISNKLNVIELKNIICDFKLIELNVSYINIVDIMELDMLYIVNIKINYCNIKSFPTRKISNFCNLLDLSNNDIQGIFYLEHTNCKFIYLDNNKIEEIFLPYSCNTISMNSNRCKIIELYSPVMRGSFSNNCIEIFKISKWMEDCNITNNQIVCIENIDKCEKLQYLNANYNLIKELDITKNKLLKKLFLKHNQIEILDGLDECINLDILDLSNNKIEIFEIPLNINRIDLSNNPLKLWEWMIIGNLINNDNSGGLTSNIQNMVCNFLINSTISPSNKNTYDKMVNNIDTKNKKKLHTNIYLNQIETEEFCNISNELIELINMNKNVEIMINIYYKNNKYIEIDNEIYSKLTNKINICLYKEQFYDWIKEDKTDNTIKLYRKGILTLLS